MRQRKDRRTDRPIMVPAMGELGLMLRPASMDRLLERVNYKLAQQFYARKEQATKQ